LLGGEFAVHGVSFAGLFRYQWTVDSIADESGVERLPNVARNQEVMFFNM
jgi:hypothetical protein